MEPGTCWSLALPEDGGPLFAEASRREFIAGPGIRLGAPALITRQEEVAPLVLAAVGWLPGQA